MPIHWSAENDRKFFIKIVETHGLSIDYKKVADAWDGPNKPTPRALSERFAKIRRLAGGAADVSNTSGGGRKTIASTPRRAPASTAAKTPVSSARKRKAKKGSESEDADDYMTPSDDESPTKSRKTMAGSAARVRSILAAASGVDSADGTDGDGGLDGYYDMGPRVRIKQEPGIDPTDPDPFKNGTFARAAAEASRIHDIANSSDFLFNSTAPPHQTGFDNSFAIDYHSGVGMSNLSSDNAGFNTSPVAHSFESMDGSADIPGHTPNSQGFQTAIINGMHFADSGNGNTGRAMQSNVSSHPNLFAATSDMRISRSPQPLPMPATTKFKTKSASPTKVQEKISTQESNFSECSTPINEDSALNSTIAMHRPSRSASARASKSFPAYAQWHKGLAEEDGEKSSVEDSAESQFEDDEMDFV